MITKDEAKKLLIRYCDGGIKNMEVVPHLAEYCSEFPDLMKMDIPELLEELVRENKLVEIEYILPQWNNTVKSFFLPVGTEIRSIRGPFTGSVPLK